MPENSQEMLQRTKVRILVGVCSCHAARDRREACRETWLSQLPDGIAYKFFLGNKPKEEEKKPGMEAPLCLPEEDWSDVVQLNVNDSYAYLPSKGIAFYQYALEHYEFDWLFKCDDDTYVALERLESLCRSDCDMIGDVSVLKRSSPSGGAGYLMNKRLVERFVEHAHEVPETGAEDVIFGIMASDLGASLRADKRLYLGNDLPPTKNNEQVSCHWCSPQRLRDIHLLRFHQDDATLFRATHPHWRDEIRFFSNGRFMRCHTGCAGTFCYEKEQRILRLMWDDWDEERLELQPNGDYFNSSGFRIYTGKHESTQTDCVPEARLMKCVFLTAPGEVVGEAWHTMQLGYDVEIYPITQEVHTAGAYNTPSRFLPSALHQVLLDTRYRDQEDIVFCTSRSVPLVEAEALRQLVQSAMVACGDVDMLQLSHPSVSSEATTKDASFEDAKFVRAPLSPETFSHSFDLERMSALFIPSRSREKVASFLAKCSSVDEPPNQSEKSLVIYACSENLFLLKESVCAPHRFRIAGLLSSYKRFKELQRQIGCMMIQDYAEFHLFVAIKGISEFDFLRIIEPQFRHFVDEGRLTMRLFPNRNQLSNLLDTVRDLDVSSFDLFAKIDDDDIYGYDYFSRLNEFHGMLPEGLGSYHAGIGGFYHPKRGFPAVGEGYFGLYGPTLVIPKRVLNILFDYEKDPESVLDLFPIEDHDYLRSSFCFHEDALIDFINRRMGACNRAVYSEVLGRELSVIVSQDTPSVLRGSYVNQDQQNCMNGTRLDPHADEYLLYLVHPEWSDYLKLLGTRVCRLDEHEEGTALYFDNRILIIKWDNWGEEVFEKNARGCFVLKQPDSP